jgi:hypothetical protein
VRQHAPVDDHLRGRDLPRLRGGGDRRGARRGACLAELLPRVRHRIAAAAALRLHRPTRDSARPRPAQLDADLRPVGVEFLREDRREPRVPALAELDVLGDDRHVVVRCDAHESIRGEHVPRRRRALSGGAVEPESDQESHRAGASCQELPACRHQGSWPSRGWRRASARRWRSGRGLPVIAASMSLSVGFATSQSRAIADMIWRGQVLEAFPGTAMSPEQFVG